ncbi:hypothetical protein N657DRAFT_653819 [Parathielavia appendiculata]|uniref:Chromo domain-containing protein n=1 Tax=Parathielavia appendiculata TaxID=2587402 RepID=A0AAN6U877_9PEZI|nr:hypothetical protein N657DRAFT_653819 [Parathielavia appendiculata]
MTKQVPSRKSSKPKRRKSAPVKATTREPSSGDALFEIRDILDEKFVKGKLYYQVDWADNPSTGEQYDPTWEPAENVTEAAVADWERQQRRRQEIDPESSIPTPVSDSQLLPDRNSRSKRGREASVSKERDVASKRPRHSVDSGYTSTYGDGDGDGHGEASWRHVQSIPEKKGDIVLEIKRRPGFDPSEYQLISSQSAPSSQALTADVPASQGDRNPISQRTIPDSQDWLDSLRTQSTAQSLANPSQRGSQPALEGATAQDIARTSRSDLDIPSRQPESSHRNSGPSSNLLETQDEQLSPASTSTESRLGGLNLPSQESPWGEGLLTQPELPIPLLEVETSQRDSATIGHSFPGTSESLPHSQAAQRVSVPLSNLGLLTQVLEVAGSTSEDIVPETVQRPPLRTLLSQPASLGSVNSPPGNEPSHPATSARGRVQSLALTPNNKLMNAPGQGKPPSAVEMLRQLQHSVFGSGTPTKPPGEPKQEPALVSLSAVLPAMGNLAEQLEASAAPADSSAPDPTPAEQQAVSEFNQHSDMAFNMRPENTSIDAQSMEFEQPPATVAPSDLTTSVEPIAGDHILINADDSAPIASGSEQFPLDENADEEKEDDSQHFTVTLPMAASTRAKYLEVLLENRSTMIEFGEVFASPSYVVPDASLVLKIDEIFERLLNLCDLPAYDDDLPELSKEEMMKHATNTNSKFSFVYEFLNCLWDINVRILIISQPGRVFEYLEAVVSATDCAYSILAQEGLSGQEFTEGASVVLAVTGQDLAKVQGGVDVVIAFDHTSRLIELPPTLGYESMAPIVLSLVATFSLDHIDEQLAQHDLDLDPLERRNTLNLATAMAREYLKPNHEHLYTEQYHEPHEAAKTFANFLRNPEIGLDWEPHPLPSDIFEVWMSSQEPQAQSADAVTGPGRKRPLDNVDEGTPKRARLQGSQEPSRIATPARMTDLLKQTLTNHMVQTKAITQVIIDVPVEQLEMMSSRIAELEAQLAAKTAIEAKLRERFTSLESQLRSHERTVQTLQPKYMEALRDRSTFEKQCQKAVERFEAQRAEVEALREKNKVLESKLAEVNDALANSTIPEVAKLAQAEKQRDETIASVEKLEKKIRSLQNEVEYSRKAYQDASNSYTELSQENQELKKRVADLETRAGENVFKIHQLHAQNEAKEVSKQIDELQALLQSRERELERAKEELRLLKNGRRETRQASVPRSPRTGVMSPRPNRVVGGAGSRGTSPAPFASSDGPGVGGGGTPVPGMAFLPAAGNGGRWGHLRD